MEQKNLDIYGNKPIPWSRALAALEAPSTKPHIAGVGALWVDGNFTS
jgi:hypothetical protein